MSGQKFNDARSPLVFLDGLRGFAAFYVMVAHSHWLLWEGYSKGYLLHPDTYNLAEKILVYFLACFRYDHQAVLFFFVLSGFVIHLRYSLTLKENRATEKFDWIPFIKRRARRLYPPLLLAMLMTYIVDKLGPQLDAQTIADIPYYLKQSYLVDPSYTWTTGLGNLFFLMTAYVPIWGTDGPLWSLKYEWWFYMTYPLFWIISKRSILMASVAMLGLYAASERVDLGPLGLIDDVFSIMLVWWLGVVLADIYTGRISINIHWVSVFVVLLPFLVIGKTLFWTPVIWGLFFSGIIALCLWVQSKRIQLRLLESLKWLGDMSYTLYVIHFPILFLVSRYLISRDPGCYQLPAHFHWMFLGILVCLCVAYLCHFVVERPFVSRKRVT